MTLDEARELLLKDAARFQTKRKGSLGLNAWAKHNGIPQSRVSEFLNGKRLPNKQVLAALGLELRIVVK